MALKIPEQPHYFTVTTSSERNTGWHDGAMVFVKDVNSFYVLSNGSWVAVSSGGGSGSSPWTDGSGNIYPTTAADNVTIGGTTDAGTSGQGVLVMEEGENNGLHSSKSSNRSTGIG